MLSKLLLKEDIFRLFSYYLQRERMSMLRVDTMAMLSRLLLKKDIFGLCSYCSRRERISMLRVGTMLSRVLLKDDITVVWIHYRTSITTFGNSLTLLMKANEILLSDRMFTPGQF